MITVLLANLYKIIIVIKKKCTSAFLSVNKNYERCLHLNSLIINKDLKSIKTNIQSSNFYIY